MANPSLDLAQIHQNSEDWLWNDTTMIGKNCLMLIIMIGSYDILSRCASDHVATSFPLLLIKPCSDIILMYVMQHIEDTLL